MLIRLKKSCECVFLSIHAIGRERLKRLKKLLLAGETPKDKRGKNIKGNIVNAETRELIRNHINTFPVKESHYSGKEFKYLDVQLNILKNTRIVY